MKIDFQNKSAFIFYLTVLSAFIYLQGALYYYLGGTGRPEGLKWIFMINSWVTALICLSRRKWIISTFLGIYTLVLFLNILYFRNYQSLIPLEAFVTTDISTLPLLWSSSLFLIKWYDLFLWLPLAAIIYTSTQVNPKWKTIHKIIVINCSLAFGLLGITYLYNWENTRNDFVMRFNCMTSLGARPYGYFGYLFYNITSNDKYITLSDKEKEHITAFLDHHNAHAQLTNEKSKHNILLIVVESLESFVIGKTIDGNEITPFLNRISHNKRSFFAKNITSQIGCGMSSDGQFVINTGILPLANTAVCNLKETNYPSLAATLTQYNAYKSTVTIVGTESELWNQSLLSLKTGYADLLGREFFPTAPANTTGIYDHELATIATNLADTLPQPYLLQVVTTTSHMPYELDNKLKTFTITSPIAPQVARYLEIINYTDRALQQLFEQTDTLNTTIIITGDHFAFSPIIRPQLLKSDNTTASLIGENGYLPLIIYNGEIQGTSDAVLGQIDIYPTILDVVGIAHTWHGIGVSATQHPIAPLEKRMENAWEMCQQIILGNYFSSK